MARPQLTLDQIDQMSRGQIEAYADARRQELETEKREQSEEAERDAIKRQFVAEGGSVEDFDREWPRIKRERSAARIRQIDQGARSAALRRTSETL